MSDQDKAITPLLTQYQAIKREHQDVILLFRLGDFYEMFGEDAKIGSQVLELTLTSREIGKGRRVPMCGLPYHALERYLPRLLAAGHKAAVCDQMEDAKKARGIVKREVTRILTPGTVVEDYLLEEKANNFLVSLTREGENFGLAALDCSTGDFRVTEIAALPRLLEEVSRLQPAEILLASELLADENFRAALAQAHTCAITPTEEALFLTATPEQMLLRHFSVSALSGFGCEALPAAQRAAAGALIYLQQTQKSALQQIRALSTYATSEFMVLDATTRRNLELFNNLRDNTKANTLLALLDGTITAMGGRLLRGWLGAPLLDLGEIHRRQQAVGALVKSPADREKIRQALKSIADIERLVARSAAAAAHGRDLSGLRDSLTAAPELFSLLEKNPQLAALAEGVDPVADLRELLARALADSPPITLREGNIIRPGYSEALDKLRRAKTEGKEWIASLETKERERTGIKSLKIGFNSVFGYYLEISRPNLPSVPADYIRKQTLANAERFITPDLKEYESLVLGAEEKIAALEFELFCELRAKVAAEASRLQALAGRIATIDVLAALAEAAVRNHYVCPQVEVGEALEIHEGRHPVVEVTQGEPFIPNDCRLDGSDQQVIIITGPNMAGKSTYLRQTALIVLMAQIGAFVPAKSAAIGLVDRIFTRVGAADDLASGRSTFMLEMTEAANILHNATGKSLIILDEIGRGTSTFDGLSIAWAVAEYIHNALAGAKTLFATHYHQLNELAETLPRIKNYRVAVKEKGDSVIFLRKVVPGGTDRSYGIHVARLAGLPQPVLERAKEVLWSLEQSNHIGLPAEALAKAGQPKFMSPPPSFQMAMFEPKENPLLAELAALDLDDMTPREALSKLAEIQVRLKTKNAKPKVEGLP
jgi:DNA mismatch repair protein MutS